MPLNEKCLKRFPRTRVLVIGDIMLDRFEYGKVERISPEAPVPVFRFQSEKWMLGGAGNVVANLTGLNCRTGFLGMAGDDANGAFLRDQLEKTGAATRLFTLPGVPTIIKTRLIAGNNHLLRDDVEKLVPFPAERLAELETTLEQLLPATDIVLLSDYAKGLFTPEVTRKIITLCARRDIPVVIDPKGSDYRKYSGAFLLKPNLKEFSEATRRTYDPRSPQFRDTVLTGARQLFDAFKIRNLLVTLSEYGMIFIPAAAPEQAFQIATEAREVFDVSGAGDTSLAVIGAALGSKMPVAEAIELANIASGIVVGKLGTAAVTPAELAEELRFRRRTASSKDSLGHKILTVEQARKQIAAARTAGNQTIGYLQGTFDGCHYGHLHTLEQAKRQCDQLFVGMPRGNTARLDEKSRITLIASLEFVDGVIPADPAELETLPEQLAPDLLFRTGCDPSRAVPAGCEVQILPFLEKYRRQDGK